MTTRQQFNRMLALCSGDRDLAARLSGFDPALEPQVVRRVVRRFRKPPKREEPWEIDRTDCPLAKRYGVR